MFSAWKQGQSVRAQRLARPIAELTAVLFRETNPVPLKQALALLGLMSSAVRLPLVRLSEPHRIELSEMLLRMCHQYTEHMIGSVETAPHSRSQLDRLADIKLLFVARVTTCQAKTALQVRYQANQCRVQWCTIACLSPACLSTLPFTQLWNPSP
jgi:hypothetical protein